VVPERERIGFVVIGNAPPQQSTAPHGLSLGDLPLAIAMNEVQPNVGDARLAHVMDSEVVRDALHDCRQAIENFVIAGAALTAAKLHWLFVNDLTGRKLGEDVLCPIYRLAEDCFVRCAHARKADRSESWLLAG